MATTPALRIGPADHGRAMSLAEFLDAQEDEGYRYELARGTLEVSEVPNDPHGMVEWRPGPGRPKNWTGRGRRPALP